MSTTSRPFTPEHRADDAARPPADLRARLRRFAAIVLVFVAIGPPVGGTVFWAEMLAIEHSRDHALSNAAPALFVMVLLSYPLGAPLALVAGMIHAAAAIWWRDSSILLPLVTGCALGAVGAAALVWMTPPSEFANFRREYGSALQLLLPVSLIATLVCWYFTRRLTRVE